MIFIPSPLLSGPNFAGSPGPLSDTESKCAVADLAIRTVMSPLAYFEELVISSLTMKPSGMASAVGNLTFVPVTTTARPAPCGNNRSARSSHAHVALIIVREQLLIVRERRESALKLLKIAALV
jgi:hypothetical protein